jgi:hypothetical protein
VVPRSRLPTKIRAGMALPLLVGRGGGPSPHQARRVQ